MDQRINAHGTLLKPGVLDQRSAPTPSGAFGIGHAGRPLAPSNRAVNTPQASNAQYIHGQAAASSGGAIPAGAGNAYAFPHKLPGHAHAQGPTLSPYQQQIAAQALAQANQQHNAAEHQRLQELHRQEQQRYTERIRQIEEENRQMNERRLQRDGSAQPGRPPPTTTNPNLAAAAAANLAAAAAAAKARAAAAAGSSAATAISVDDEEGADTGLGDGVEEQLFANVSTAELEAAGLRPHPDRISETSALASVGMPHVDYRMSLPVKVLQSKQLGKG